MKTLIPALVLLLAIHSALAGEDRLNLLIITVDDMSADSIATYGCELKDTAPNMDALCHAGLRFEHAHVQVGNCMPSRNVMWSGLYPHNNGVEGFYQVKQATHKHLVDFLNNAGYFTAIRHKVSHSTPYSPYGWDLVLDTTSDGKKAHVKDAASYGHSVTEAIIAANKSEQPFCVMINVSDPHKPFYAEGRGGVTVPDKHVPTHVFKPKEVPIPGFLFDDPVVRKELAHYYSSVRRADDCVGAALKALKKSGHYDRTAIVFLSDHGMPLPFAKTQLYHHSTHTPLVVIWPGVTKPDVVDAQHMVSAVDLTPTILDIVGIETEEKFDGRSFAPILRGEAQEGRDYVIKEYNENAGASRDPMRGIQTKKYLYLFNPWSNGSRVFATATTGTSTYRRMAQLAKTNDELAKRHELYQHRVPEELYDIDNDPDCLHNLIKTEEHQAELAKLRTQLEKSLAATSDPILDVFRHRDDAAYREAYVVAVEKEATERRGNRQKNNRQKQNKK